ncbi:hypothetical protein BKA66DRAFT_446467 [Pyrenochaeta sp. MPI-SDFR-AT-0127]|nr:hypothetical protein BKA66DRAFT_446467 [Pyrenochaeta sp. MPI-SDFR-AT-0127]
MVFLQQLYWFLFSLPISKGIFGYNNTTQACVSLLSTLPGQVFFPGSKEYENSMSSYAYIGTRLRPTCLSCPKTTDDVAAIIQNLGKFDSVAFAVRSGGHNTNKGFADINDGITIDLSTINAVELKRSAGIVAVGSGARWQNVYNALDPYSLSVQGGRNGDVGVGGFLTGGGIGFFSPERGWACDSIANVEIVLSTGEIINANLTNHADLFAALKGGQNNFGIVTRFDLKIFTQGPLWGGVVLYSNSTDKELLDTFTAFKDPIKFDPYAMLTFGFVYDTAHRTFAADIAMYHSHPESVNGSTLESFAKIQPQLYNSLRTGSPGSFAGEKENLSPVVKSFYMDWATITFAMSRSTLAHIHTAFKRTSVALADKFPSANLTTACSIQSVPVAAPVYNPNSLGFNATSHPEKNLVNYGIAFQYEDPIATEGLRQAIKELTAELEQIAKADGVDDEHLYLNYAGSWQNVFAGYGRENLKNMRRVAKYYDKSEMFQKQVKGGFKLYD